jgi:hypothetical protein
MTHRWRVGRTGLEPAAPRIEWAEHGSEVEVNAGDQVILQPPANLENGEKVQIALGTPAATPSIR